MTTMSLRLLFGMLASAVPEQHNYIETMEVPEKAFLPSSEDWTSEFELAENYAETYITGAARLHIGMLTISLIVGLAYGGYVAYTCWTDKDIFLGYIRNLVIALVCRTFFTIIFDGVVLLGSPFNVGGGNALSALEQIFINLVLGFWLSLTVYAHARVQRNFKSEPTLRLYQFGIPAVAAFFAFVWIFAMQYACPNMLWWAVLNPFSPWIVHSTNLLFLLIQLALVGDMCRMMMPVKSSLDNDSLSLLWKVAAMMAALLLIFWLQFGLSLGYYKLKQSYLYFFFFIDGIEGTLVSVCFYFFYRWVIPLRKISHLSVGSGETEITSVDEREAEVLPGGRGIVTVDSICVTTESGRWKTPEEESSKDVVYSNVVEPHRLQKTLQLYNRFNVIPNQVTVVEGEQFYECHIPPLEPERINQKASPALIQRKMMEPAQKKNAFYASKYLILDSKEGEIPKYLETRPSVSSESPKEEKRGKTDPFTGLEVGELVRKWLNDNSENMLKNRKPESMIEDKELNRKDSDLKTSEASTETTEESLTVEKMENNRVEFGKQNVPKPPPTLHPETPISLDLSKENEAGAPKTETPADAQNTTTGTPSEGAPNQSLNASVPDPKHQVANTSDACAPGPTKMNEPEAKDEPVEPIKPYLTYSELLELRSKREKSDELPASTTESILSKVISAGSHFLTSLTGFVQADRDFTTDEGLPREPHTKDEQEVQTGEKMKELPREEAKHSDLTISSLPEKPTAEQVEDAGTSPESTKERELTSIKSDEFDIRGMQNLETQSFIADQEQLPQKLTEEELTSSESSLGGDSTLQTPIEYRQESLEPPIIERQSLDIRKVQPPHNLTEDKEKSPERFSGSKLVQQPLDLNKAQPPQTIKDKEELLETSSDSEFSLEKRQSFPSVLRIPKGGNEKSVERFSGSKSARESFDSNQNLQLQKLIQDEEESLAASSDSEFSIEKRQSFTKREPIQKYPLLRTLNAAASQPQATAESDPEVTLDRKQSSSSCESFSLQNYYAQVMRARSQFQNGETRLRPN